MHATAGAWLVVWVRPPGPTSLVAMLMHSLFGKLNVYKPHTNILLWVRPPGPTSLVAMLMHSLFGKLSVYKPHANILFRTRDVCRQGGRLWW